MPAQKYIQSPFQVVNHMIPYRAILLLLHVMKDHQFNTLLNVLSSNHVIETRAGKYYLMVGGSKMYYRHHNFYTGKRSSEEALSLISVVDIPTLRLWSVHTFLLKLYEDVEDSSNPSLSMSHRDKSCLGEILMIRIFNNSLTLLSFWKDIFNLVCYLHS